MAADATLTARSIYLEDVATTANPNGETANANVMQADGSTAVVVLNKIAFIPLTSYTQAANDGAAATAGVPVGGHYWNTTTSFPHTRMT